jgi:hypothetical protein
MLAAVAVAEVVAPALVALVALVVVAKSGYLAGKEKATNC